jgi:hypothetical protein
VHTNRANWLRAAVAAAELMHFISAMIIGVHDPDDGR